MSMLWLTTLCLCKCLTISALVVEDVFIIIDSETSMDNNMVAFSLMTENDNLNDELSNAYNIFIQSSESQEWQIMSHKNDTFLLVSDSELIMPLSLRFTLNDINSSHSNWTFVNFINDLSENAIYELDFNDIDATMSTTLEFDPSLSVSELDDDKTDQETQNNIFANIIGYNMLLIILICIVIFFVLLCFCGIAICCGLYGYKYQEIQSQSNNDNNNNIQPNAATIAADIALSKMKSLSQSLRRYSKDKNANNNSNNNDKIISYAKRNDRHSQTTSAKHMRNDNDGYPLYNKIDTSTMQMCMDQDDYDVDIDQTDDPSQHLSIAIPKLHQHHYDMANVKATRLSVSKSWNYQKREHSISIEPGSCSRKMNGKHSRSNGIPPFLKSRSITDEEMDINHSPLNDRYCHSYALSHGDLERIRHGSVVEKCGVRIKLQDRNSNSNTSNHNKHPHNLTLPKMSNTYSASMSDDSNNNNRRSVSSLLSYQTQRESNSSNTKSYERKRNCLKSNNLIHKTINEHDDRMSISSPSSSNESMYDSDVEEEDGYTTPTAGYSHNFEPSKTNNMVTLNEEPEDGAESFKEGVDRININSTCL